MTAPSLCGNFVTDKRSLIAFTWTLTCVLTFTAFITCGAYLIHIHTTYIRLEHSYYEQWYSNYQSYQQQQQQQNQNDNEDGNNDNNNQQQHSADREWEENNEFSFTLNDMRSGSMTLISMYIFMITTAMTCYGSTAIVGFTSLRGIYIAPCFSSHDPATLSLKLGIFGGAIVLFANLLLICAVILGEVRVRYWFELDYVFLFSLSFFLVDSNTLNCTYSLYKLHAFSLHYEWYRWKIGVIIKKMNTTMNRMPNNNNYHTKLNVLRPYWLSRVCS
jgi:hypothetical protein